MPVAELDVSVVLPAHNEEKLVGAAIASIAASDSPSLLLGTTHRSAPWSTASTSER